MLAWGALERGRTGVRLGVKLLELGYLVPAHVRLRELAMPFAHNLNEATQLTSNLAIRDGKEILYVEKIASRALRVPHSRAGGRLPLHCTALGKAILAFSDPDFVETIIDDGLPRLSEKTITDAAVLRSQLARIRASGVAYDVEESRAGLFCVASPLFSPTRVLVGAISVTGATALAQAQNFAPAIQATAKAISRALQSNGRSGDLRTR
jgi:DNA-binding IclR family transcriptional regulator